MTRQTAKEYLESIKDLVSVNEEASAPTLPITILVSEGERVDQAFLFRQLQYEPILIPTIPCTDRADRAILSDTAKGEGYIPSELDHGEANGWKNKVRSLRMSWVFALDLMPKLNSDLEGSIICERRAVPMVDAATLYTIIKKVISEHPDTDVIRLFDQHTYDKYTLDTLDNVEVGDLNRTDISVELPAGKERTRLSAYCDGTYAMFISDKARSKVAELFRTVRMPVDTALEYASSTGELNVRTLTVNAFIREGSPARLYDRYKYCVQLSSYSRPMQVLWQIMSIKEQLRYVSDPSRIFVHVVLRGCDKLTYKAIKARADLELKPYNFKIVARPNRSQVLNFVEAPKGYDFYLKMDDDDFYDPLYLASTVAYHDKLPACLCSTMTGDSRGVAVCMRSLEQDRAIVRLDKTGACENTLVFSEAMCDHLVRLAATTRIYTTSGKATDAVPMRTLINSKLGFNRYEYWRFMSIMAGRDVSVFSILNYEGAAHATSQSNFGAFAVTAGPTAAEYYTRIFDTAEYLKEQTVSTIRENFTLYTGIDVAIVVDNPGDVEGMYIPMSTKWCSTETGAAQPIKDIEYMDDGAFVAGFTFCRSGNRYIYDPVRGVMVPKYAYDLWKEDPNNSKLAFQDWLMMQIVKPGEEPALN